MGGDLTAIIIDDFTGNAGIFSAANLTFAVCEFTATVNDHRTLRCQLAIAVINTAAVCAQILAALNQTCAIINISFGIKRNVTTTGKHSLGIINVIVYIKSNTTSGYNLTFAIIKVG